MDSTLLAPGSKRLGSGVKCYGHMTDKREAGVAGKGIDCELLGLQ